jgi:Amt family ammonium transporter
MYEAGAVREHNVVSTYAKNVLDFLLGVLVAAFWGYNMAYPHDHVNSVLDLDGALGSHNTRLSIFFHLVFQATAATIVSGAMAERTSLTAYLFYSLFMSGVIYTAAVRSTWGGGWLSQMEPAFHDYSGSGIVHLTGGVAAFCGAAIVGARNGRWERTMEGTFTPHSIPSMISGMFLLWVGWYGFNPGSSQAFSTINDASEVSATFITTTYSAACGGGIILFLSTSYSRGRACDVISVCNGILGGLVAITAGCDAFDPPYSMLTGAIAGLVYLGTAHVVEWLRVDDVVGAFAVHGTCGIWGVLSVGLFHRDTGVLFGSGPGQLYTQAIGVAFLIVLSAVPTLLVLGILKKLGVLRVSAEEEAEGLDSKLGVSAYAHRNKELQECQWIAGVLAPSGVTPQDVLAALQNLDKIVFRTFTPQAGDNKLRGEVEDILDHFDYSQSETSFLSFCSHHKKDGGEVARVFVDQVRRALSENSNPERQDALDRLPAERRVFLDSNNLKDLSKLCDYVGLSQNHVILMTRSVLSRPWVLAEIVKGFTSNRNVVCVMVDWPDKHFDPRSFRFPQDLNKAIKQWKDYIAVAPGVRTMSPSRGKLRDMMSKMRSKTSSSSTLSNMAVSKQGSIMSKQVSSDSFPDMDHTPVVYV